MPPNDTLAHPPATPSAVTPAVLVPSGRTTAERRWWAVALAGCTVLLLTSCAAGANPAMGAGPEPAGFWFGLWHGLISPITVIVSFFRDDINIYEVRNSGNWYDFGFMVGVSMILGGSHGGRYAAGGSRRERGGRAG